jgi:hypothetical protein
MHVDVDARSLAPDNSERIGSIELQSTKLDLGLKQ